MLVNYENKSYSLEIYQILTPPISSTNCLENSPGPCIEEPENKVLPILKVEPVKDDFFLFNCHLQTIPKLSHATNLKIRDVLNKIGN
jgi:hypothetical protein